MQFDAIVVGGGITGLAAAYELAARGVRAILLEGSDRAGGLILTDRIAGFTIEAGAESMLAQKPAAIQLCEELGLGPRLIATNPPRTAFVLKGERLYALPSPSILGIPTTWRGILRYDLLSPGERARLALEPLVPRARRRRERDDGRDGRDAAADESVASFFRRRFGPATVDLIAAPLLGGIHAGSIETLSVRSLFPRLVDAESRRGVMREFRGARNVVPGMFRSLSSGMGELVTALVNRLPEQPALGMLVESVRRDDDVWRVYTREGDMTARAVILAIPAPAAARVLATSAPPVAALCDAVPYVSTASVALAWPSDAVPHPLSGSGFVVARRDTDVRITACTWVSSKWEGRAPAGHVLLRAFLGGAHDPDAALLSDDELIGIARRDLGKVLGIDRDPLLARAYRWLDAGAQHVVGHLARMERLDQLLDGLPGLFVAGSGFRSIGIPDCIADGRVAGAAAAQYVKIPS